jgi:hypothetical protein
VISLFVRRIVFYILGCILILGELVVQVLVRLVGADDHVYPNYLEVMQWLAESNLLEMIVDKLSPSVSVIMHKVWDQCGLCSLVV